jgi:hypothetical protein
MAEEKKHTAFALQALGFADLFNIKIGDQKVSGHRVEMSAPDGPSTGGGKQAVQHIKLIPDDGSGSVIVAGSANQMEKTAEVRSYEYLADLHSKRFKGARLPLDKASYNLLVARVKAFFAEHELSVSMLDAPRPAGGSEVDRAPGGGNMSTMVVVFLVVALAIAGAVFFLLRSKHG